MAQHIDKQKYIFHQDKRTRNDTKFGASPHGVLMQPMEKIEKL